MRRRTMTPGPQPDTVRSARDKRRHAGPPRRRGAASAPALDSLRAHYQPGSSDAALYCKRGGDSDSNRCAHLRDHRKMTTCRSGAATLLALLLSARAASALYCYEGAKGMNEWGIADWRDTQVRPVNALLPRELPALR